MSRRGFLAAVFCLCLLPAGGLRAADPTCNLRIEVTNREGKPVDRASVVIKFDRGRAIRKFGKKQVVTWQLRTNQEGVAKIPPVPYGDVLVQVIAKNFQTWGEVIKVEEPEKTVLVVLNPPQTQYSAHQ